MQSWLTEKDPDAGKNWRQKEKGVAEDATVNSTTDTMDMNLGILQEMAEHRGAWWAAVNGVMKSWTQLSNWTITNNRKQKSISKTDIFV